MSYRLRLILRILFWLCRPHFDVTKEYRGEYRVWPTEAELLHRWQKFTIITKPLMWDDKWFYFEQRIESSGKLVCSAVISCIFLAKDRKIPTAEILNIIGVQTPSPPFSDSVNKFIAAADALNE